MGWEFGRVAQFLYGMPPLCMRLLPGLALRQEEEEELPFDVVKTLKELCDIHQRCICSITSSTGLMYL